MKIIDYFRNLFKKDNTKNVSLVSLRDTINISSRESLSEEENSLIDEYKREYLKLLNNRVLFSGNLDLEEMTQEVNMNFDLVTNLFMRDDIGVLDYIDEYDNFALIKKANKMNLYLGEILRISKKVELSLIALEEILASGKVILPSKKRAIKCKCENLIIILRTFKTQGEAIGLEVASYLKELELNNVKFDGDFLLEQKRKVLEFIKAVMPDKYDYYKSFISSENKLGLICELEIVLERFIYSQKGIINKEYFERLLDACINERPQNPVDTYKQMLDIETKIKVFSLYGKGIVDDDLINKLYSYKFKILEILYIYYLHNNPNEDILTYEELEQHERIKNLKLNKFTYAELECYDKIIMSIIHKIVTGESNNIGNIISKSALKELLKAFRNKDGNFSSYDILDDDRKLSLLIFLDYYGVNGIRRFLENYMVNIKRYYLPQYKDFKWNYKVPLITILQLNYIGYLGVEDDLFPLYKLVRENLRLVDDVNWCGVSILQGLEEIRIGTIPIKGSKQDEHGKFIEKIMDITKGMEVIMPSSFRSFMGKFPFECNSLTLNDGCEHFSGEITKGSNMTLSIPASLKWLKVTSMLLNPNQVVGTIIFRDYENSQILNDDILLKEFCKNLFYKDFNSKKCTSMYAVEIKPNFNRLILESKYERIILSANELSYVSSSIDRRRFLPSEIKEFIDVFREKIAKKHEENMKDNVSLRVVNSSVLEDKEQKRYLGVIK